MERDIGFYVNVLGDLNRYLVGEHMQPIGEAQRRLVVKNLQKMALQGLTVRRLWPP